jgi:RNA polymerase sigma factor (TIGR02999 family)
MDTGEVTELIRKFRTGDRLAEEQLLEILYPELRTIAARLMRRERQGHTLQTTALVNEAYIRIVGSGQLNFEDRAQLLGLASRVMRNLLIDRARSKNSQRHGGNQYKLSLDQLDLGTLEMAAEDLISVHEALNALAQEDERCAKALEGHYFGGLSEKELAACMGVSSRTVKRDLNYAKAWIYDRLAPTRR